MAQWLSICLPRKPPTNVARVRFLALAPYVGWVCCWFSSLLRGFFSGYSSFPPSAKTNISKFKFNLECTVTFERVPRELFGAPWVNKLHLHFILFYVYLASHTDFAGVDEVTLNTLPNLWLLVVVDSVTDMLSSLKWRSLELRRSDARLCMLYKQSNGLATYECDKLQKEHKSRMDIRLSSISHRSEQPRCACDYFKDSFYPRTIA